jgi:hypothetical protein
LRATNLEHWLPLVAAGRILAAEAIEASERPMARSARRGFKIRLTFE